jgi:hypothetical protein
LRIVPTSYGARLTERGNYLSKVLRRPGPTHDVFDVLAAAVACFAPGPRAAILGFGGGGMIAPLRALGFGHPVRGVDRSAVGARAFRTLCRSWAGPVRVDRADAVEWLRRMPAGIDTLVDDLSVPGATGATKPDASLSDVPRLAERKLGRRGVLVVNGLPLDDRPWAAAIDAWSLPGRRVLEIRLARHENRVVVAGRSLPAARVASRRLRSALAGIGSTMAADVAVRSLATRR